MDIYINFIETTGYGLDELEDIFDKAFDRIGEVTGSGSGKDGSNIDIQLYKNSLDHGLILEKIRETLNSINCHKNVEITICHRYNIAEPENS